MMNAKDMLRKEKTCAGVQISRERVIEGFTQPKKYRNIISKFCFRLIHRIRTVLSVI